MWAVVQKVKFSLWVWWSLELKGFLPMCYSMKLWPCPQICYQTINTLAPPLLCNVDLRTGEYYQEVFVCINSYSFKSSKYLVYFCRHVVNNKLYKLLVFYSFSFVLLFIVYCVETMYRIPQRTNNLNWNWQYSFHLF